MLDLCAGEARPSTSLNLLVKLSSPGRKLHNSSAWFFGYEIVCAYVSTMWLFWTAEYFGSIEWNKLFLRAWILELFQIIWNFWIKHRPNDMILWPFFCVLPICREFSPKVLWWLLSDPLEIKVYPLLSISGINVLWRLVPLALFMSSRKGWP